jgi:hypothetical protein
MSVSEIFRKSSRSDELWLPTHQNSKRGCTARCEVVRAARGAPSRSNSPGTTLTSYTRDTEQHGQYNTSNKRLLPSTLRDRAWRVASGRSHLSPDTKTIMDDARWAGGAGRLEQFQRAWACCGLKAARHGSHAKHGARPRYNSVGTVNLCRPSSHYCQVRVSRRRRASAALAASSTWVRASGE